MSPGARFKRALITLLLELARVYGLTLNVNRDSEDDQVKAGFRKVILRAHPEHASSRLKFPICCQRGVCQPRAG